MFWGKKPKLLGFYFNLLSSSKVVVVVAVIIIKVIIVLGALLRADGSNPGLLKVLKK